MANYKKHEVKGNILALSIDLSKGSNSVGKAKLLLLLAEVSFGESSTGISLALKTDSSSGKAGFSFLLAFWRV